VCVNAGKKSQIIACVNWGFYIDDGTPTKVTFDPSPPEVSGTAQQQVRDALDRFEMIPGNTPANIQF
jgi:hypothetical protein